MNEIKHIRLSELTKQIAGVISQSFGTASHWIVAEISSHKFYQDQDRHYFEFIEKTEGSNDPVAKVRGVSWSGGSRNVALFEKATGQKFGNGVQVLVQVKVEFHPAYGFSLVLLDIDQSFTLGNLEKQRRETLVRLVAENPDSVQKEGGEYLTKNKKIQLPAVIQTIAIIGSRHSEGYTDFIHTLNDNQFNYKFSVDIYESAVQGAASEKELINQLIAIYKSGIPYDCVVLIRGGGSKTDFIVFDSYGLSRAIARFPIPVIAGIGHHKDISIVDLMANTSMKTPTKAAEFVISRNRVFEDNMIILQKTVIIRSQQLLSHCFQGIHSANVVMIHQSRTIISHYRNKLYDFNQVVVNNTKTILYNRQTNLVSLLNNLLSKPKMITSNKRSDLNNLLSNLNILSKKYLISKQGYLGHFASVIKLVSPENTLKRGFAIISADDRILKDADCISPGASLKITMLDYHINTKVISKTKSNGNESLL